MYDKIRVKDYNHTNTWNLPLQCPRCSKLGTFEGIQNIADLNNSNISIICLRRCPNLECRLVVFLVVTLGPARNILIQWPPSRIKFEAENVPEKITSALNEAIECHANQCYRASAAMVRRTLEEICDDKEAEGKDLFKRIEALKDQVTIAPALFEGMHEIRFLGNDGVHLELKSFDNVGDPELTVAIELTKKIIEGIYQTDDLVKKIQALKKT